MNIRDVVDNTLNGTFITTTDPAGPGGAYHNYQVYDKNEHTLLGDIKFQNGPRNDPKSIRGLQMEDLLYICIDRLECFQNGEYHTLENQIALDHCKAALATLQYRTKCRMKRGVEGTLQK